MNPEIYDPATETWSLLPPHFWGRMYHSTTLLLPDARVLSVGQDFGSGAFTGEIFSPPYLFRGPQPRILSVPRRIRYGTEFVLDSPQADSIQSIALIAPTANTHSVNNHQRYVALSFVPDGPGALRVTAPAHGDLAPPGYYMLFLLDDCDVPSVARFVHVS